MSAREIAPVEMALRYCQEAPAFLVPDGLEGRLIVFSPQKKMPMWVHRSIHAHQAAIERGIHDGLIELCPARQLHAPYYHYLGNGQYECTLCKQFAQKWGIC
jgi:hypothetical protein